MICHTCELYEAPTPAALEDITLILRGDLPLHFLKFYIEEIYNKTQLERDLYHLVNRKETLPNIPKSAVTKSPGVISKGAIHVPVVINSPALRLMP